MSAATITSPDTATHMALAKQQLGLPANAQDSAVPRTYLDELKLHLSISPYDTKFHIVFQPKTGFGSVVCLEKGCGSSPIALGPRKNAADGGKKDGFGALAFYRTHATTHAHKQARLARLKAENAANKGAVADESHRDAPSSRESMIPRGFLLAMLDAGIGGAVADEPHRGAPLLRETDTPRGSLLATLDAGIGGSAKPVTPARPLLPSSQNQHARRSLARVEPAEPVVPRKRQSSSLIFLGAEDDDNNRAKHGDNDRAKHGDNDRAKHDDDKAKHDGSSPSAAKRAKVEPPKTLLSYFKPNAGVQPPPASRAAAPPALPPAAPPARTSAVPPARPALTPAASRALPPAAPPAPTPATPEATSLEDARRKFSQTVVDLTDLENARSELGLEGRQMTLDAHIAALTAQKDRCAALIARLTRPASAAKVPTASIAKVPAASAAKVPAALGQRDIPGLPPAVAQLMFAGQNPHARGLPAVASGSNVRLGGAEFPYYGSDDERSDDDLPAVVAGFNVRLGGAALFPNFHPDAMDADDERFDSDGDFYGRGKDTFVGPVANADDIAKFLVSAGNAEQFDGNASVDKALERLGLRGQYQLLPGMAVSLMPHQTIGVAWALDREKSADRGGCLSDEMGLGKTVQIIAVMVANASGDPLCKSNLIVAPTALLDQWALEIETKTTSGMRCLIYHGPSKPKKRNELLKYDVVLTTYQTLALEWPDYEAEQKAKEKLMRMKKKGESFVVSDSDDDVKPKKRGKKKELGLLFTINWYRVILDEAQNIRNRKTRTSRSVTDLDSKYRWCLTGTPIINGLTDAYPLFRFLKFRPWYDWSEFNNHVAKYEKRNPNLASKRLQAMFQVMLLRRKKDSTLDGKKLIELPPKNVQLEKLAFSQEERDIYKMVEVRSQARFNRFLKAGTVLKNYTQVLVMLLRLRQICSHPALIQEQADALVSPTDLDLDGHQDIDAQNERARAMRLVSPDFVKRLRDRYRDAALARMEAERESADATADGEECPICMDTFTDAVVTPCTHAFCRECIVSVLDAPFAQDMDDPHKYRANERPCPSCRSAISADKLFSRGAFEPTDEELQGKPAPEKEVIDIDSDDEMLGISELVRRDAKGKGKRTRRAAYDSEDEQDEERDDDMSDFIVESDEDEEEKDARRALKKSLGKRRAMVVESDDEMDDVVIGAPRTQEALPTGPVKMMSKFLPSTKMKRMMEHLVRWAEANPGEKTIVISQWTECLKLVSDYLTENHMPHVKYQGSMSRAQRDQAVRAFMIGSKAEVMLMSLKCGGVGLNLTRANRVISLDLGWSEAIESQAFDRVHRLGQTKEVFVQRLVIADTVEDRVLALQERKKNLADGSLGEGTGKKIGRLSVAELANLFGLDRRGNVL